MSELEPIRFRYFVLWTRDESPRLAEAWRCQLLEHLARWARQLGALPLALGGSESRIWGILGPAPAGDEAALVDELRARASAWVAGQSGNGGLAWEDAYAWIPLTAEELSLLVDLAEESVGAQLEPAPREEWLFLEEPAGVRDEASIR